MAVLNTDFALVRAQVTELPIGIEVTLTVVSEAALHTLFVHTGVQIPRQSLTVSIFHTNFTGVGSGITFGLVTVVSTVSVFFALHTLLVHTGLVHRVGTVSIDSTLHTLIRSSVTNRIFPITVVVTCALDTRAEAILRRTDVSAVRVAFFI